MISLVYELSVIAHDFKIKNKLYPTNAMIPEIKWNKMIKDYEVVGIFKAPNSKRFLGLDIEFGPELKVWAK